MISKVKINKKGVTPIIAVVLLLMMTIVAFGGAYMWLTSFQEKTQSEVEGIVKQKIANVGTQLQVLSVYADSGITYIVMYNNGKNIIPGSLLNNMVVLIDKKPVPESDVSSSTADDIPPNGNFDIRINGDIFSDFGLKDYNLHTITIKMGDLEINYHCGPLSPSEESSC